MDKPVEMSDDLFCISVGELKKLYAEAQQDIYSALIAAYRQGLIKGLSAVDQRQ